MKFKSMRPAPKKQRFNFINDWASFNSGFGWYFTIFSFSVGNVQTADQELNDQLRGVTIVILGLGVRIG